MAAPATRTVVSLAPGAVMMLAVLFPNRVGDSLLDAMDPHTGSH